MTAQQLGVCPACNGTARRPVPENTQRYIRYNARWGHWGISGYEPAGEGPFVDGQGYEGGTLACGNCGGDTMSGKATGRVPLRPDGTPCLHEHVLLPESNPRRGYHSYKCKHCGYKHVIDSGD